MASIHTSPIAFFCPLNWQCKVKRRSFIGDGLSIDPSPVLVHYLLTDRQTDAGSGILAAGVQPLENDEDALEVFLGNPDAVILDAEVPHLAFAFDADVNFRAAFAAELGTAVTQAVRAPFRVRDESGAVVAEGFVGGEGVAVPAGSYTVQIITGEVQRMAVIVNGGEAVVVEAR